MRLHRLITNCSWCFLFMFCRSDHTIWADRARQYYKFFRWSRTPWICEVFDFDTGVLLIVVSPLCCCDRFVCILFNTWNYPGIELWCSILGPVTCRCCPIWCRLSQRCFTFITYDFSLYCGFHSSSPTTVINGKKSLLVCSTHFWVFLATVGRLFSGLDAYFRNRTLVFEILIFFLGFRLLLVYCLHWLRLVVIFLVLTR